MNNQNNYNPFEIIETKLDYYSKPINKDDVKLSPSSIAKFLNNAGSWYIENVGDRVKVFDGNTKTVLGTCIHYIAEQYMKNGELEAESEILLAESNVVETSKRLALYLLNEGICEFGQDLKHQQQIADILANIFMDIYVAESTVLRAKKMLENPTRFPSVEDVAKIFVAEMAQRMVQLAETALKGIYNGNLSPLMHENLNAFRSRMYLPTNTIGLKREIAAYAYSKKGYPY